MKSFLIGLLSLISLSAFASDPGIGSFALYNIKAGNVAGTMKLELIDFDENLKRFTQRTTMTVKGRTSKEDQFLEAEQVSTKAALELAVSLCTHPQIGGKKVKIKVAAGKFDTCRMVKDGSTIHMAAVPFGVVKMTRKGLTMELKSFKYK